MPRASLRSAVAPVEVPAGLPSDLLARRRADSGPLQIIDLACGTGANLRYLAPRLGGDLVPGPGLEVDLLRRLDALPLLALGLASASAAGDESRHPVTLWQVEGATNSVYLLGSIHLLRAQDHPLPRAIDAAYGDAEIIVMELDMDDLDPVYTQAAFNEAGVLTDGRTLRDLMGADLYAQAETAAAAADTGTARYGTGIRHTRRRARHGHTDARRDPVRKRYG